MLGSLTVNTILTFGVILVVVVVGMIVTYPDIAVVPIVLACVAVAVLVPLLVYPVHVHDLGRHRSRHAPAAAGRGRRRLGGAPAGTCRRVSSRDT